MDGASFSSLEEKNAVHTVVFNGIIWQDQAGQATWRIVHYGALTVRVDDAVVLEVPDSSGRRVNEIDVRWERDWLEISIEYRHGVPSAADNTPFEFGIYERIAFGQWRLIPSYRLYPTLPTSVHARSQLRWHSIYLVSLWGLILVVVVVLVHISRGLLQQRKLWLLSGVVLVALVVRMVLLFDRAQSDPGFWYLAPGADNYVMMARETMAGNDLISGAYFTPGNITYLLVVMLVSGPELWKLYLLNTILGSFSVGAVAGAGWLGFGRRIGLLAGLLLALYPPLIFYHTTLQIVSLSASLVGFTFLSIMMLWCKPSLSNAVGVGVLIGLSALVRTTTLLFLPALVVAMLHPHFFPVDADNRQWRKIRVVVVITIAVGCTIAPQTLANASTDNPSLISSNGPANFLIGNNRDASGVYLLTPAYRAAKARVESGNGTLTSQTVDEICYDPLRAVTLQFHKLGVFFGQDEYPNVIDYKQQGLEISPFLRVLSLNGNWGMVVLMWLATIGVVYTYLNKSSSYLFPLLWLLTLLIGSFTLGTVAFIVMGRIRAPVVPLLTVPAAIGIYRLYNAMRYIRFDKTILRALLLSFVGISCLLWFDNTFPIKPFRQGDIPSSAVVIAHDFGDVLRLRGYEMVESDHRSGGYAYVNLYWEAIQPLSKDYIALIYAYDETVGTAVASTDHVLLGAVSYPPVGTSRWKLGRVLKEAYFVELPITTTPVLQIHVAVIDPDTGEWLDSIYLVSLGLADSSYPRKSQSDLTPHGYQWDYLYLNAFELPTLPIQGIIEIRFEWIALKPIGEDYVIYIHVLDRNGMLVAQSDSPIIDTFWRTSALLPYQLVEDVRVIDLPDALESDEYTLQMGVYRYPSLVPIGAVYNIGTIFIAD